MKPAITLYLEITGAILEALAAGPGPAALPWHRQGALVPRNVVTGSAYRGINVLVLWARAQTSAFSTQTWATYRQWLSLGAQVRKGERAAWVVFFKAQGAKSEDSNGDEEHRRQACTARSYAVFNAAQIDGWTPPSVPVLSDGERVVSAEAFFSTIDATVLHGGDEAFYRPSEDTIYMPPFAAFQSAEAYYAVLAHEHIHWTGAVQRLDRGLTGPRNFRSYAAEELVAELGAAFVCATLGLSTSPRSDHAAYIGGWVSLLRDDPRTLPKAASLAAKATDYLVDLAETVRRANLPAANHSTIAA